MKNFRKVLALILVVATLFSLTAMISAKTTEDYKDGEDVNYVEAVDVLSAIGILEGYTDNSFQPTKNIQREEMAKMVAVLSNAGDDVEDLYASACTFADSKNSWAASYIAYCTQTGIVAGRSASIFDPDANVTGLETAKMLLVVLGFDATEQGYVGTNWKTNVLRDAKNIGLLNGFADGYDVSKAITREEAAQMFLNALTAPIVVGTISNNIVSISNAVYRKDSALTKITLKDAEKYGWVALYGNVIVSDEQLYSIYAGLDLASARDCYGRPGHAWTYTSAKGTVLDAAFYVNNADLTYTTTATLSKDLKEEADNGYDMIYFVDGDAKQSYRELDDKNANYADLNTIRDRLTGNGVRTEVYVNDRAKTVDIVIINTYIDKVTSVNNKNNTFTLSNGKTYSNKGRNFAKDDVVLYWLCNGNDIDATNPDTWQYTATLHDAEVVKPENLKISRTITNKNNVSDPAESSFIAGGETYEYAFNFGVTIEPNKKAIADVNVNETKAVYLDKYGYVMYWTEAVDTTEYLYAYGVEKTGREYRDYKDVDGKWNYSFDALYVPVAENPAVSDRTNIDEDLFDALVARDNLNNGSGLLFKYYVDSEGVLTYVESATLADQGAYIDSWYGKIAYADSTANSFRNSIFLDDETEFLVRVWDYVNKEYVYSYFKGLDELTHDYDGTVDLFNGKSQVGIQYFAENNIASVVFIDAQTEYSYDSFFLINYYRSIADTTMAEQFGATDAYKAMVDGEEVLVLLQEGYYWDDNAGRNGQWIALPDDGTAINKMFDASLEFTNYTMDDMKVYVSTTLEAPLAGYAGATYKDGKINFLNEDGSVNYSERPASTSVPLYVVEMKNSTTNKAVLSAEDKLTVQDDLGYYANASADDSDDWTFVRAYPVYDSYGYVSALYVVVMD